MATTMASSRGAVIAASAHLHVPASCNAESPEARRKPWVALHQLLRVVVIPGFPARVARRFGVARRDVLVRHALVCVRRHVVGVLPVAGLGILCNRRE